MSSLKIIYSVVFQFYGLLFYLLAQILFRIRVYGKGNLSLWQKQNNLGYVFVARHLSCWDPVLLAAAFWKLQLEHIFLYGKTKYVAKNNLRTLFKCIPCLSSYVILINQKNTKKSTLKKIINLLREGVSIVIFPEGTVVPKYKKIGGLVSLVIEQVEKITNQKITIFPIKIDPQGPCAYGKPKGNWLNYLSRRVKVYFKIGDSVSIKDLEKMLGGNEKNKNEKRKAMVEKLLNLADQI